MMGGRCLRAVLLALVLAVVLADYKPPTVYVYTRNPLEIGVKNELICYMDGFHPPRSTVSLMKDKVKFENSVESDLSFQQDWTYHKTIYVPFTPEKGVKYECEVNHNEMGAKYYQLESLI